MALLFHLQQFCLIAYLLVSQCGMHSGKAEAGAAIVLLSYMFWMNTAAILHLRLTPWSGLCGIALAGQQLELTWGRAHAAASQVGQMRGRACSAAH